MTIRDCPVCGTPVARMARGLCTRCYHRAWERANRSGGTFDPTPTVPRPSPVTECGFCGKKVHRGSRGLCFLCYGRARIHEKKGLGFDPTYRPREYRGRPPVAHPPCKSCGSPEHYYASGLCRNCYSRALRNHQKLGVFDPQYRQSPMLPVLVVPTTLVVLRALLDLPPEIESRQFTRIGSELARLTGVSRQRVDQLLGKLRRRGWIRFQIRACLPPEVETYVREAITKSPWPNSEAAASKAAQAGATPAGDAGGEDGEDVPVV